MNGPGLLDRVVQREPLDGHDGRSGARLERVVLDDGTRLVVKRTSPAVDLVMRATGATIQGEYLLWAGGVFDRLPAEIGNSVVDAWKEGDETVLVMRDLGGATVGWGRRISRAECRRVFEAATALHRTFDAPPVAGLCRIIDRVSLFAHDRMAAQVASGHPLPPLVLRGWERFQELVPRDAVDLVFGVLDHPERLAGPLSRQPAGLLHGDLWLVNVALEHDRVVLLDWDLATWAPPALDFGLFLDGNASQVQASPEQIVDDYREIAGDRYDEVALRLAYVAGLVELGWNKALDVAEHADPAVRAREREQLAWWVAQARRTAELGLLDG